MNNLYLNNPPQIVYSIICVIVLLVVARGARASKMFPVLIVALTAFSIWFGFKLGIY